MAMRVTSSGVDVAGELRALSDVWPSLPGELSQAAADVGAPAVLDAVRVSRGSLTMSNNKRLRGELEILPIVKGAGELSAYAELQAVPRGVWHLVEHGSQLYSQERVGSGRGKNRKKGMPTPYGIKSRVGPRQVRGSGVLTQAMETAEPDVERAVEGRFDELIDGTLP